MNLLVLKRKFGFEFYRFDALGEILQINEGTFLKGLKSIKGSDVQGHDNRIQNYFRKAGVRYYYIPTEKV